MRIFTIFTAIGVIAFAVGGEEFKVLHREKAARDAMNFESRHLSVEQCDSMNFVVGRGMKWNNSDEAFIDTTAAVEAMETTVGAREALTSEKTPAWVSEIQQRGDTYQVEKNQKAKRNKDRLSAYSQTELSIAKNMGLNPWDIDREQLRLWGLETDTILLRL